MSSNTNKYALVNILLLLLFLLERGCATIAPSDKTKVKSKQLKIKTGSRNETVYDLNLISKEPLAKDILINNDAYFWDTKVRHFNGTVLGYITPWNPKGYDIVRLFAAKINIISPVWFQITKYNNNYKIVGDHDVDVAWLNDVRQENGKIFPRFIFEKFTDHDYSLLLSTSSEKERLIDLIISTCIQYGFDGIILEYWTQLSGRVNNKYLINLAVDFSLGLQKHQLKLILVIPPYREEMNSAFTQQHYDKLYKYMYAFSLMTYDFSSVHRPGANAPLYWMRKSVEHIVPNNCQNFKEKRKKILMGLNMYGNDYTPDGGGPIINTQYLDLLSFVKKRLLHDEHDEENFFEVRTTTGRHYVFYPTLYSIDARIKLATEMGVGLSIWELGQGLKYFYDLF